MKSGILENFIKKYPVVTFDPYHSEHMKEAKELLFNYKQGIYRFRLEEGFESVPQMMLHRIAQKALGVSIGI